MHIHLYVDMSINDGRNNYCLFFSLTLHVFKQKIFCTPIRLGKRIMKTALIVHGVKAPGVGCTKAGLSTR